MYQNKYDWKKHTSVFLKKEVDEKRNYFIEKIKQSKVTSRNHKKICKVINYTVHLLF